MGKCIFWRKAWNRCTKFKFWNFLERPLYEISEHGFNYILKSTHKYCFPPFFPSKEGENTTNIGCIPDSRPYFFPNIFWSGSVCLGQRNFFLPKCVEKKQNETKQNKTKNKQNILRWHAVRWLFSCHTKRVYPKTTFTVPMINVTYLCCLHYSLTAAQTLVEL